MTWVKIDDQLVDNRKIDRLSDRAFRLYMAGLCFCGAQLTDGVLLAKDVRVISAKVRATKKNVEELVDGELWIPAGGDGYTVKDFLDYNPTRDQVTEERRKARERKRKQRGHGVTDGVTHTGRPASPSSSRKDQRPLRSSLSPSLDLVMDRARETAALREAGAA